MTDGRRAEAPVLLLVHGWGFDAGFWTPLEAALAALMPEVPVVAWDLGFFGRPSRPPLPPGRPVMAVGHSFGFQWLLKERPVSWRWLVSINGFARFTQGPDFAEGVAPRLVQRMRSRLAADPTAVLEEFRHRAGIDAGNAADGVPAGADVAALSAGLDGLAEWDLRPAGGRPVPANLALAGRADAIVPEGVSRATFAIARLAWNPGGHLLPLEDPAWCAEQLARLAAGPAEGGR